MKKKVYLIRTDNGRYKIGISKDPNKRILELQTGNSDELVLIDTYESENASKIETTLHNRFFHRRKHGEWFEMSIIDELNFHGLCETIDSNIKFLRNQSNIFV